MMNAMSINELGEIDLKKVITTDGHIDVFLPIKTVGDELDGLLDRLEEDFLSKHPEVKKPIFTLNLNDSFGGFTNAGQPETELEVIIWDESNEDVAEFYEEIKVNLSDEAMTKVKRAVWEGLGHMFFGV